MRLIDADDLEPDADYDDGEYWAYSVWQIENALTIEERKKGKWIRDNIYEPESGFVNPLICSECKCKAVVDLYGEYVTSDFCPNCGAGLRKVVRIPYPEKKQEDE